MTRRTTLPPLPSLLAGELDQAADCRGAFLLVDGTDLQCPWSKGTAPTAAERSAMVQIRRHLDLPTDAYWITPDGSMRPARVTEHWLKHRATMHAVVKV